jgi:hypothetical protein
MGRQRGWRAAGGKGLQDEWASCLLACSLGAGRYHITFISASYINPIPCCMHNTSSTRDVHIASLHCVSVVLCPGSRELSPSPAGIQVGYIQFL